MKFSKKGDKGETSLLGGQRVPKFDPRPDTYGTLDEASSVLGVARAGTKNQRIREILLGVQKDLLTLGAVLSTLPEDLDKLLEKFPTTYALNIGCQSLSSEMVDAAHAKGIRIFSNVINLPPWQTRSCMRRPILLGADVAQIDNLRVFNEVMTEIKQNPEP